jgi:histidinol dehydrogenase
MDDLYISSDEVDTMQTELSEKLKAAIAMADENISLTNAELMAHSQDWHKEIKPGHTVGAKYTPVKTALLWVPARKAPLLSTAIMLVTPARVAGVENIIVATPPTVSGKPDKATLAAAKMAGATHFICGNGVSLIAAAVMGKLKVPKPDVIYGPGPDAIALTMIEAMKFGVRSQPGIGPSDSIIIADADEYSVRDYQTLARDLFNEAEHGKDSYTYILTTSAEHAENMEVHIREHLLSNLERKDILESVVKDSQVGIIVFDDEDNLFNFVNSFCPEHLMVYDEKEGAEKGLSKIHNAGEILLGKHTPFTSGNYHIGVTAVLPTNGYARAYGGINAGSYIKESSVARLSSSALRDLQPVIQEFGKREGLPNHVEAVNFRTLDNQ